MPSPKTTLVKPKGTHVGVGIEAAIEQLDAYVPDENIIGQAIVIVGDGRPDAVSRAQGLYPESDYYNVCGGNCSDGELAQMANLAADDADDKGYDVFVVFYDEDNDDTAAEFYEGLVRGAGRFHRTHAKSLAAGAAKVAATAPPSTV